MKIPITSQELEILRKSAEGLTARQIAVELNTDPKIVAKTQKGNLSTNFNFECDECTSGAGAKRF